MSSAQRIALICTYLHADRLAPQPPGKSDGKRARGSNPMVLQRTSSGPRGHFTATRKRTKAFRPPLMPAFTPCTRSFPRCSTTRARNSCCRCDGVGWSDHATQSVVVTVSSEAPARARLWWRVHQGAARVQVLQVGCCYSCQQHMSGPTVAPR